MYYHCRAFKYVRYGKVGPKPAEALDSGFAQAYLWLSQYCGFFPQVWLSRGSKRITAFRFREDRKGPLPEEVLFGFETIQGFPVAYDLWCELLYSCLFQSNSLGESNRRVYSRLEDRSSRLDSREEPISQSWLATHDVQAVLWKHLFVQDNQVVVPRLNLKAAKVVICRDERQKRLLRQMGFLEDRLVIRGPRP